MNKELPQFGDYVTIEQKRYGADNEHYLHKVIGVLESNCWVEVPVQGPQKEVNHDQFETVVACITCGVSEREVFYYRLKDIRKIQTNTNECTAIYLV